MLDRVKLAMRISTDVFDSELAGYIAAAIADLRHVGAQFDAEPVESNGITDYSVEDPLAAMAIITYCRLMFGSPADYDRLRACYDMQKGQMRESRAYGMEAL